MPKRRSRVRAFLGVFALVAGVSWIPATAVAQPAAGNISILSDGPDNTGNPYNLTVVASDSTAITSMTAHFMQGTKDVYDATMTPLDTSNPASQKWAPASMVPAVNLVAGTYTVTIDASDGTESDTGLTAPSPLIVTYINTLVSVTPSPSFVTQGSQNVTFSGTVTGEAKDGMNTQVPIGGVTVNVSDGNQVTTNASGAFNYTAHGLTQSTMFEFTVPPAGDGSYPAGDSGTIQISAQNATTTVSVTPSQNNVSQGSEQVVFSGQVTAVPAGGGAAVPVPGATVNLSVGGGSTSQVATTKADGSFSYTASNVSAATDYLFSVPGTNLYGPASKDVPIGTTQAATAITVLPSVPFVTQGANNVSLAGTVTVTPPGGSATGIGAGVPVQVTVNGQPAGTVTTTDAAGDFSYAANGLTASTSFTFTVTATTLYSAGTDNITIPAMQAQTAVNVTPTPGQIELGSQNVTFAGQVLITPPGGTTAVPIGPGVSVSVSGGSFSTTVQTDSSGNFTVPVNGLVTATNFTFSVAQTNLYTAASDQVQVQAAAPAQTKITLATPGVSTFGSPSVTLTGTVTALNATSNWVNVANVPVYLNGGSTQVAMTNSSGQFSYDYPGPPANPNLTFSVNADPNNLYTSASTPLLVNVTPGQTAMSVHTSPAIVDEGPMTVTFTVKLTVTPAGSTTPQPIGAGVPVLVTIDGGVPAAAGPTDANGVLTDTISNVFPGDDFNFSMASAALYTTASADFAFGKESTKLTVQPSQPSVTEGSQDVTFSGTATGMVPGGTAVAINGAAVTLDLNGTSSTVATTDSNGKFSYTAHGIVKAGTYQFSITPPASAPYTPGSASVAIGLVQAKTRITVSKIPPLLYGQQATVQGLFQYQKGTTWIGIPAMQVHLAEGTKSQGNVVTAQYGKFTGKLATTNGSAWSAKVGAATLTQQATAAGNLLIAMPTKVNAFTAALYKDRTVHSSGCLVVTAPNVKNAPMTKIQIQYATSTRGPWKVLGLLQLHNFDRKAKGCANPNEAYFSGAIRTTVYNAYYRAALPWSNAFQGAVSTAIHCARNNTKIIDFDVKPRSITSGSQSGTVSGKLMHKVGNLWKPYANKRIIFPYRFPGTSGFYYLGNQTGGGTFSILTSKQGTFKVQPIPKDVNSTFSAFIYAEYVGTGMDLTAWSPGIEVTVHKNTTSTIVPDPAPQVSAMIVTPASAQAAMLAEQDLLILGRMPDQPVIS